MIYDKGRLKEIILFAKNWLAKIKSTQLIIQYLINISHLINFEFIYLVSVESF